MEKLKTEQSKKLRGFCFLILLFAAFGVAAPLRALTHCTGKQIFSSAACAGDEITAEETELHQIINEYRQANRLPPVTISKSLSLTANRHLLDLRQNLKQTTHAWSDCPYNIKDQKTWNCVTDAPKRFDREFAGQGFENLYRNLKGSAAAAAALEAWKKSELHNSLLLNLGIWRAKNWDAFGVAIHGEYAAVWFGARGAGGGNLKAGKGLGVSFEEVVKNLTSVVAIEKSSSVAEKDIWVGASKDKAVVLELLGTTDDIERAAFSLKIRLAPSQNLTAAHKKLLLVFLKNVLSVTTEGETWLDENFVKLRNTPGATKSLMKDGKAVEMRFDRKNFFVLTAKPNKKSAAIEF